MNIYRPELVSGDKVRGNSVPLAVTHPKHMVPLKGSYTASGLSDLGDRVGAEAALRSGAFEDTMLKALDMVGAQQHAPGDLIEAAIVDPGSVDIHDITIAQAKAGMSLNITRTVLSRVVQGWKDIINTR